MKIELLAKVVYGQTLYYPSCDRSIEACKLTGTRTLTPFHIHTLENMGFEVVIHTSAIPTIKG